MKKSFGISFLLFLVMSLNCFASMIPVRNFDLASIYDSPAILAATDDRSIPFGVELKGYADMDMVNFITNPAYALADAAVYLEDYFLEKDNQFLYDNYDSIKGIFRFDPSFPAKYEDINENADYIRNYLNTQFHNLDAGNRARAVSNAYNSDLMVFPKDSSLLGGDLDFSIRMYGGGINKGFGWNIGMAVVYDGVSSILSSDSYENYQYGSNLYFTLGSDLGYGAYISDNFALGVSLSSDFIFNTLIDNSSILSSRINGEFLALLANNNFNFGLNLRLNFGMMLNAGDNAKILFDFRNLPSMQMYWYFSASDIASEFQLHEDDNIYFVPPDVSLGLVWDKGPWHVEGEISNIADQLIWKAMIPSYKFDILSVPKLSFAYRILDDMSIGLGYEFRSVVLSFMWSGLKAEFSTRVDKLGFGITLGYEF